MSFNVLGGARRGLMWHFVYTFRGRKYLVRAETLVSQYGFCWGILVLITEGKGLHQYIPSVLSLCANTANQPDCVDLGHVLAELRSDGSRAIPLNLAPRRVLVNRTSKSSTQLRARRSSGNARESGSGASGIVTPLNPRGQLGTPETLIELTFRL